ncbi:MAG: DUF1015 domain-containing protein [Clostridia bacterium]|nr:DUF1015 domain-containing protein [Clostridia bacterium]
MNVCSAVFSPAEILLPAFHADAGKMSRWAVIACDQFTSSPSYWEACRAFIGDAPSTLSYIMPEAYLGTPEEGEHGERIARSMAAFSENGMKKIDGFVYLERTLPDGTVRRGLIGKIDLEAYDYAPGSVSPVRATEATVLERIPPRRKVRAEASVELPHILILVDEDVGLFDTAKALSHDAGPVYDFPLMQGGGRAVGYALEGKSADEMREKIAEYEASRRGVVYAMGDGNHSLAAAKAHWENVKRETGNLAHPARYALCEVTALGDDSLRFEPIYRVVKNADEKELLAALDKVAKPGEGGQTVTVLTKDGETAVSFTRPTHALTVGTLQDFLDPWLAAHPGASCDYIHGEDDLRALVREENAVGFLFSGMDKSELFPYVEAHGTLPRKTFSMGEAQSKRYYLEARRIVL